MTPMHAYFYRTVLISTCALLGAGCGSSETEGSAIGGLTGGGQKPDSGTQRYSGPDISGTNGAGGGSTTLSEEEVCDGLAFAAEALPVDMYIMLDKSSSMADPLEAGGTLSKWDGVVSAIQAFVQNPAAASIGVGIQYFGLPDECNPQTYAIPEVPIAPLPGVAQAIVQSTLGHLPQTLTPTGPALQGAIDHMKGWAAQNPDRASVVVLATDGFPTICQPQSIPELQMMAQQAAETDPRVLTFVIGVGQALSNLEAIARGGGTGAPFLIESGDIQGQFLNAMLSIASTPLSCEFEVPDRSPDGQAIDINKVQVVYTPTTDQPRQIPKLSQLGDCMLNQGEGWYYDHPTAPNYIKICPSTCERFAAGSVEIRLGCQPAVGIIQ